ncbi:MAG: class I SAM-dependent methyltransferase [Gammaproteobacteria bacterium]
MDWNSRYSESGFAYGIEPNDFLVSVSNEIPLGSCLSLAEGEGRNAVFLAKQGHIVTAVDSSAIGLQKAAQLATDNNVSINTVQCDLNDFNIINNQFDSIISIFCHIPVLTRQRIHKNVVAGLKPGGFFVLEAYTQKQISYGTGGPPTPELTMSLVDLKKELRGMEFLIAQEIDRKVIEGKYHTGTGAVVQVLARKN